MMSTKDQVRLVIGDLRQCVESVDCREDLATFLGQQRFGGSADGFAVINDENLEAVQPPGAA